MGAVEWVCKMRGPASVSQVISRRPIGRSTSPRSILEFDPDSVEVESGETVTFEVTNEGKNSHEFVLGDDSYQEEHAAEMSGGEEMSGDLNQIEIEPGETKSLTWTFIGDGEVRYGCHEPGHYEGGMVATIDMGS